MSRTKVAPSILGVEENVLVEKCSQLIDAGADYIHFDVMDGFFVPNKSFSAKILSKLKESLPKAFFDVHLMILNVEQRVDEYINAGADLITFHYEAVDKDNIQELINYIHGKGVKVGISIKPNTNPMVLVPFLPFIDLVLVMSVEPGKGGQSFMFSALDKIEFFFAMKVNNPLLEIEVDGGINNVTGKMCVEKGADVLVAGSYIMKADNYQEKIGSLK